ncbi:MAG: hypothetical protein NWF07_13745 [Candidatus Bathyarchaeota archaeon]|nr:hypothetical protein [Candidatus Bathyarchaeota archaeon]
MTLCTLEKDGDVYAITDKDTSIIDVLIELDVAREQRRVQDMRTLYRENKELRRRNKR